MCEPVFVVNIMHGNILLEMEPKLFRHPRRTSIEPVLPFQKCVNSVSGFANSVCYRFRFAKFRFLPFQIFKIPFHFFQAVFLL